MEFLHFNARLTVICDHVETHDEVLDKIHHASLVLDHEVDVAVGELDRQALPRVER